MSEKQDVKINIVSISPGQHVQMTVDAEMIFRGGAVYYRYSEPSEEMRGTTTTVKVRGEEIKVIRHGQIRSEQSFAPLAKLPGFYQLANGQLHLTTRTKTMDMQLNEGIGQLHWTYELDIDGNQAGTYELKLEILGGHKV